MTRFLAAFCDTILQI